MRKGILLLVLVVLLTGCTSPLAKLGYSEEDIALIEALSAENQSLFESEYRDDYLSIITHKQFKEANLESYIKYFKAFEIDDLFTFINAGYSDDELKKLSELYQDVYFIVDNAKLYLKYEQASVRKTIEYVNALNYQKHYEDAKAADMSKGIHILVNKYYYLAEDYEPDDLVQITSPYGNGGKLRQEAYDAYIKMFEAAQKDGISFYITSPYRPYSSQKRLYTTYMQSYTQSEVDSFSARPGYSEHQTGLAIDILAYGYNFGTFEQSEQSKWLKDNAYKYGFILRYPEDKEAVTGYQYESWHYRYVGDISQDVYASGLTYDEYYAYYF